MEIQRSLVLSTAHLPYALAQSMEVAHGHSLSPSDQAFWLCFQYLGDFYGYRVWVNEEFDQEDFEVPALKPAFKLATSCGCDYIIFDPDGPEESDLPTFEWP